MFKSIANMLRGLFRANAQPKADETAELAARLEENVLKLVGNMPTLPDTATRAMALANDPAADFAELARLIEGDAAIASGLLRIANSAFYSGGAPAAKLPQAVVRLGMFQCKNLIVSIGMKSLIWKMAGDEKAKCAALWHHGYITGCLCRQISRAFRLMFDGEEFSAGLLHDLGRILLLLADPDCFTRAGAMDFGETPGLLQRERAAIGIDHCALGGWFGAHSQLPEAVIQAMRLHHEPDLTQASLNEASLNEASLTENATRLVTLVASADHMANHLQRGEAIDAYNPQDNPGLARLGARWPAARKERLLGEVPILMEEAVKAAASEQAA